MIIERKDVVVRLGEHDLKRRGISADEARTRLIAKGYRNVVVYDDASFGLESPDMSPMAMAIFIGDIIQTVGEFV